jgi:predicted O-methyltransferase YrrM
LSYLEKVDFSKLSCVEFGSGASTFWFASRCKNFETFEFDEAYFRLLSENPTMEGINLVDASEVLKYFTRTNHDLEKYQLQINLDLDNLKVSQSSFNGSSKFKGGDLITKIREGIAKADCVFIDGGPRNFLIALAAEQLRSEALLVIDNSDSEYVQSGVSHLKSLGFREIPFVGYGPLNPYQWQTSIFIKSLEPLDFLK